MAKAKGIETEVMIAFKPEAEQSEIEAVLSQYPYEKIFEEGTFDISKGRREAVLARLYSLSVPIGKEQETVDKLTSEYGAIVEYAHMPAPRKLM